MKYLPYDDAKDLVCNLGVSSKLEYRSRFKGLSKKLLIPSDPEGYYKNKGWVCWSSFLNTNNNVRFVDKFNLSNRLALSYEDSKKYLYNLLVDIDKNCKINSSKSYSNFTKTDEFMEVHSKYLYARPDSVYKNRGEWLGWRDYLSIDLRTYISYDKLKSLLYENKINNIDDLNYFILYVSKDIGYNIPRDLEQSYTIRGEWISWDDLFSYNSDSKVSVDSDDIIGQIKYHMDIINDLLSKINN